MKQNEVITAVKERRTVRQYTEEKLTGEELQTLLECAMLSPSARNRQPCRVRVIADKEKLCELNTDFKNAVGWDTPAYTNWDTNPVYHNAPSLFCIFADGEAFMDAGIMVQNIAIAAKGLGLDSCIIGSLGVFMNSDKGNKWKTLMGEPENCLFQISVAVGHGKETPAAKPRIPENFTVI